MNSDIIPVLIAEDHSIKHRIMEDISIEQKNPFCIGKRDGIRNNKVKQPYLIIFYILIRILKFAFAPSFGIFYTCLQEIMILS